MTVPVCVITFALVYLKADMRANTVLVNVRLPHCERQVNKYQIENNNNHAFTMLFSDSTHYEQMENEMNCARFFPE